MTTMNQYQCPCCDFEGVVCQLCDTLYPPTKEYFYTSYGKLNLDKCKSCKKKQLKDKPKEIRNKRNKDRKKEYNRMYYQRRKLEKQQKQQQDNTANIEA